MVLTQALDRQAPSSASRSRASGWNSLPPDGRRAVGADPARRGRRGSDSGRGAGSHHGHAAVGAGARSSGAAAGPTGGEGVLDASFGGYEPVHGSFPGSLTRTAWAGQRGCRGHRGWRTTGKGPLAIMGLVAGLRTPGQRPGGRCPRTAVLAHFAAGRIVRRAATCLDFGYGSAWSPVRICEIRHAAAPSYRGE